MNNQFQNIKMVLSSRVSAVMLFSLIAFLLFSQHVWAQTGTTTVNVPKDARADIGAAVSYVLPADGELSRTYRVYALTCAGF